MSRRSLPRQGRIPATACWCLSSTAIRRGEVLQWLGSAPEDLDPPVGIMQGRKIEVAGGGAALRLGGTLSPAPVNAGRIVAELKSEQAVIRASWTTPDDAGGLS
jgi:hypothetical protein